MAGNVMWSYFATSLQMTSDTFNANAQIFGKVYFPRLTVPVSVVVINILQFIIQFVLFLGFYLFFCWRGVPVQPTFWVLALPIFILQMAMFGLGTGILISSLTTKYKDLRFAMGFMIQLWMYATPVVYPLSQVPEWLRSYYVLNPMVAIVECFREAFFGMSSLQFEHIITSWIITVFTLLVGVVMFSRIEKTFMDTV